jgi:hypothetical protein
LKYEIPAPGIQQVPIVTCVIMSGADGFIAVMAGSQNCPDCVEKIHDPCAITDGDGSISFHEKTMLNLFSPGAENCEARESMSQDFLKIRDKEDPYRYKFISDPLTQ